MKMKFMQIYSYIRIYLLICIVILGRVIVILGRVNLKDASRILHRYFMDTS